MCSAFVVGQAALLLALPAFAPRREPLRLPDGQPLVCIYYFPQWWEPWRTDDGAIRADLRRLRAAGFNTLLIDHEWSQALEGPWKWLDRNHRLATEEGLRIVPWLSLKSWCDILPGDRETKALEWFGVRVPYGETQTGERAAPLIYDEAVIRAGTRYTLQYLERYRAQNLLTLRWRSKDRPVVSLSVESAWDGSFDDRTNERFRRWLRRKYSSLARLNSAWGTDFRAFGEIDPRDPRVFDYAAERPRTDGWSRAVEDHVEFRSQTIRDSLREMARRVRARQRDVLFLAEIPYQYESAHPHADSYRVRYGANPSSCDWADIVLFRCTGPLSADEIAALDRHRKRSGQAFVLTYRTYSDWDVAPGSPAFAQSVRLYADQAADHGQGFGFYSYNEMGDTHIAFSTAMPVSEQGGWSQERAERAFGLVAAMVARYRERVAP